MKFSKSFQLAISNILSSKTRSLLTMLGIIIGIASVITLVSLMGGVTGEVTDMFDEIGTTSINISLRSRGSSRQVKDTDIYEIVSENPDIIAGVSPSVPLGASVKTPASSDSVTSTSVTGVSEIYADRAKLEFTDGMFFQYADVERLQKVCVVGSYIQDYFFGTTSAIGQTIKINGEAFRIVGVLEEKDDSSEGSSDDCIYIPYTIATRMSRNNIISSYTVYAISEETVDAAVNVLERRLTTILGDSDFYNITSMKQIRDMMNDITGMLTTALVFIAGISLLVGGIGIMNIMLVTVTERTKEIGIRKALGTKKKDILSQFVIEAATLSGIGGVIGIFLGIGLAKLVGVVMSLNATPSIGAILVSFGVSTVIGVGFGYLPAKKAATLNPIDALRSE